MRTSQTAASPPGPTPVSRLSRSVSRQLWISHGSYIYVAPIGGGTVLQFKVTVDPVSRLSQYVSRTYALGLPLLATGLGVADDLQSLMAFNEPSGTGVGQEVITKMPLCEDM